MKKQQHRTTARSGHSFLRRFALAFTAAIALLLSNIAGAQQWTKMTIPKVSGDDFHTWVWSTDTNITHVVGDDRAYHLFTHNGGATWDSVLYDAGAKYTAFDIQFLDKNTGYVCTGRTLIGGSHQVYIFKTTDGGYHWRKIPVPGIGQADCMRWIDTSFGFLGSLGGYTYTHDGGATWTTQNPQFMIQNSQQYLAYSRMQITAGGAIAIGSTLPLTITNPTTTRNYAVLYADKFATTPSLHDVPFTNPNTPSSAGFVDMIATPHRVYGIDDEHAIQYSADGAVTWNDISGNLPNATLDSNVQGVGNFNWQSMSTWFVNDTTGWIVGGAYLFLKTTNGGQSWSVSRTAGPRTKFDSSNRNRSVMVVEKGNRRVGWAVGEQGNAWKMTETIPQLAVAGTAAPARLNIYPNPATNVVVFDIDVEKKYRAAITNVLGQVVRQSPINVYHRAIDVESLPPGAYTVTLTGDDDHSHLSKQIIKNK